MSDTGPLAAGVLPVEAGLAAAGAGSLAGVGGLAAGVVPENALQNLCLASSFFRERYRGWEEVGQGAFAVVVKTHCVDRGEDVALKVFRYGGDEDDRRRLRAEVQNAQRVLSPLLVRTYSPFDHGGLRWIEMEYVDGTNLEEELRRREAARTPFSFDEALEVGLCVARALELAHRERVIHRDLKPANILLPCSRQPLAKLADFGISRFAGADRLTRTGAFAGTPKFGSPEGFKGEALGAPHDVYALGLSLYLLFTGNRFPFPLPPDYSLQALIALHCRKAPMPARAFVPALPSRLDALLLRCLEKKPAKRPSAEEVRAELEAVRAGVGVGGAEGSRRAGPRRGRRALLVAASVAVAAVATIGWSVAGRGPARAPSSGTAATGAMITPGTLPLAARSEADATSLPPPLAARINGPFLQLRNEGAAIERGDIELVTRDGRTHRSRLSEGLGAGEVGYLPLDGFRPVVEPGAEMVLVRVSGREVFLDTQ